MKRNGGAEVRSSGEDDPRWWLWKQVPDAASQFDCERSLPVPLSDTCDSWQPSSSFQVVSVSPVTNAIATLLLPRHVKVVLIVRAAITMQTTTGDDEVAISVFHRLSQTQWFSELLDNCRNLSMPEICVFSHIHTSIPWSLTTSNLYAGKLRLSWSPGVWSAQAVVILNVDTRSCLYELKVTLALIGWEEKIKNT